MGRGNSQYSLFSRHVRKVYRMERLIERFLPKADAEAKEGWANSSHSNAWLVS